MGPEIRVCEGGVLAGLEAGEGRGGPGSPEDDAGDPPSRCPGRRPITTTGPPWRSPRRCRGMTRIRPSCLSARRISAISSVEGEGGSGNRAPRTARRGAGCAAGAERRASAARWAHAAGELARQPVEKVAEPRSPRAARDPAPARRARRAADHLGAERHVVEHSCAIRTACPSWSMYPTRGEGPVPTSRPRGSTRPEDGRIQPGDERDSVLLPQPT